MKWSNRLLEIVPEATAVRSHSMVQSSVLLDLFKSRGLSHDCNHFVPAAAGIELKPWRLWNGLAKVPYVWEDDLHCVAPGVTPVELTQQPGLCVVDFHPIHLMLNTEDLSRYEAARSDFAAPDRLAARSNTGEGAATWLTDLLRIGDAHDDR